MSKRKDYLTWDEYFMGIALLSSYRSKDPNTQVADGHNTVFIVYYAGAYLCVGVLASVG